MTLQPRMPVEVYLRLQETPDQYLNVETAFAKQPEGVYDALLEAICLVPLRSTHITLLGILNTI